MKKNLFTAIATLTAVFGMTACSSSDDLNGGDNQGNSGQSQYITVSLVTNQAGSQVLGAKAAHTRADNNQNGNGTYHDGTIDEGKINNVRFFFFDANGNPVVVNGSNNYIDHDFSDSTAASGNNSTTTERRYATLVLNPVRGNIPSQVDVVANTSGLSKATESGYDPLTSLTNSRLDLGSQGTSTILTSTFNNASSKDNFVMSSSKYTDDAGIIHFSVPTVGHIHDTPESANADPIDIYVERLAAKVVAQKGGNSSKWIKVVEGQDNHWTEANAETAGAKDAFVLYDGTENDDPTFVTGSSTTQKYKVIAVVNGWGLADEKPTGYVFKNIQNSVSNSFWSDNSSLGFVFSWPQAHRSFWETSPAGTERTNHSWDDYTQTSPTNFSAPTLNSDYAADNATALYTMPNTPTRAYPSAEANNSGSQTYLTKLLVAATLLYQPTGQSYYEPATICQLDGNRYLGTDNLKTQILANNPIVVGRYNETTNTVTEWYSLGLNDLTINGPQDNQPDNKQFIENFSYNGGKVGETLGANEHWVYAQGQILGDSTTTSTPSEWTLWYNNSNYRGDYGLSQAQALLSRSINRAMIWNAGKTYYYTSIRHLGQNESDLGYFGVVRNHEYRMSVLSFAGFGTPVYDPGHIIIPVKPSTSDTYLSAAINVLQWRVVNNNVDFDSNVNTSSSSTAKRR